MTDLSSEWSQYPGSVIDLVKATGYPEEILNSHAMKRFRSVPEYAVRRIRDAMLAAREKSDG